MTQTFKLNHERASEILKTSSEEEFLEYYRRMIQSDIIEKHTGLTLIRVDDQYRRLDKSIYLYQMITNLKKMKEQGLFRKERECYYANT